MATTGGPRIFNTYDLADIQWYMDITNPDCWDGSAISNDPITKLYNLADETGTYFLRTYADTMTSTNYDISRKRIQRKYGTDGNANSNFISSDNNGQVAFPTFTSATTGAKSGFVFLKGLVGSGNQSTNNIYLGGFEGRLSFRVASSGVTNQPGVLMYWEAGGGGLSRTNNTDVTDGNWHSLGYKVVGNGSSIYMTIYIDGKNVSYGSYSFDGNELPNSNKKIVMGGWSDTYGEFTGEYGNWILFDTELDDTDFKQLHNSFFNKYRYL